MKTWIKAPAHPQLNVSKPTFMMIGMMRSGSNFLERRIGQLPSVRCHGELFNPHFIGFAADCPKPFVGFKREDTALRNQDSIGFLNKIIEGSGRSHVGFRMFLDHDPAVMAEALFNPAVKKIVLTRNLLDSYVSLLIARETDVWLTTEQARQDQAEKVTVNVNELATFALRQSLFYNDMLTLLQRTGQRYFHIDYSEIKNLDCLNGMVEFLGIDDRFTTADEPIKRQNPARQEDKIANYSELLDELRKRKLARWFI
jgi:hypothetical protein